MVSICVRRGLVGLVVAMLCVSMGCVDPKSSGGGKTPKEPAEVKVPKEPAEVKVPRLEFCGLGGSANHVVYLIDRSGSMFDIFDAVKGKIADSVNDLQPDQDFHVIMFADGDPLEKQPMTLTPSTDRYKSALAKFLVKVKAERTTNPIKAINRAFDVLDKANKKPGKIIYMLTDGAFPDNEAVIATIRARNIRKDVHVNTFLYGWKPPTAVKIMKQIATENGGRYLYVSPDE
ncbi:MAG: VWA domain-containing protein [bacterium]|nr:VWA domain-containing protein [bacterium]